MNAIIISVTVIICVLTFSYIGILIWHYGCIGIMYDHIDHREKITLKDMQSILDGLIAGVHRGNNMYGSPTEHCGPQITIFDPDNTGGKRVNINITFLIDQFDISSTGSYIYSEYKPVLLYTGPVRSLIFRRYARKALLSLHDSIYTGTYANRLMDEILRAI